MTELTQQELRALKFYIGDVSGNDPFWSDDKAYVLLNALFFSGIDTEKARAKEGKRLNPAILADTERLIDFFSSLLGIFKKTAAESPLTVFRVERFSDYSLCKKARRTISFTSTSTAGFLPAYQDRLGIALMKFELPAETPCINVGSLLDKYAKPDEAEILLPPFMRLDFSEEPISPEHKKITDAAGAPPLVFSKVYPKGMTVSNGGYIEIPAGGAKAGQRVCSALMENIEPDSNDTALYSEWKASLCHNIWNII